ncbi:MAG: PIG-L family deacetylase [Deltaproteobacteria bacterium]|nr:PIG-L family deacetylase [Deltaproteobacteria bacterium]
MTALRSHARRTARTEERLLRRGRRLGVTPQTIDVLYVSPHADDVAFSAAGQIARDRARGLRVAVMTLFEASGGPAEFDSAVRREEDAAFARVAGVELVSAGFEDAIVRQASYRWTPMIFAPLRGEGALVSAVRDALQRFVYARGCTRVVGPLGVGGHVDHQVAHLACRDLYGASVSFYEDTPYVLSEYQLARRLSRLGMAAITSDADPTVERGSVREELSASAATWMSAPFIVDRVKPSLRPAAVATILSPELLAWPARNGARPHRVVASVVDDASVEDVKLDAVACYASQWPFYHRDLAGWRDSLERYARAMGRDRIVERTWSIVP